MSSTKPVGGAIPNSFKVTNGEITTNYEVAVFKRSNNQVLVEHAMQAIEDFVKKGYEVEVDWIYPLGVNPEEVNG